MAGCKILLPYYSKMSTAIIIGAGSNIGVGVTKRFLEDGYKVATVSRSESLTIDFGPNLKHIKADLVHF